MEKKSAWNLTKVRSKKEVIDEARTSGATIQRDHQKCSQEIGNTSGSRYALQDKQEQSKLWEMVIHPIKIKSKLACILEASESTRLRMGESLSKHHEDHIAGKGDHARQHYNLVQRWTRNGEKLEKNRRGT